MLENDPPPGTRVYLLNDVRTPLRTAKAFEDAELVKTLQPWTGEDLPTDRFVVRIGDEQVTVRRDQIRRSR